MGITGTNYLPPMPAAAASDELIPPTDQAIAIHDYHLTPNRGDHDVSESSVTR
jgi:hypothetical protein